MNISHIRKKNRETFYDYASGEQTCVLKIKFVKVLIVLVLACLFPLIRNDFFNITITIYAIFTGFSFSILFFLLSMNFYDIESEKILEDKEKKRKLNRLLEELFYNVSYFNIVAFSLILISLLGYIPNSAALWLQNLCANLASGAKVYFLCENGLVAFQFILALGFYTFLIESIYTLLRTVERVFYFFHERLQLKR